MTIHRRGDDPRRRLRQDAEVNRCRMQWAEDHAAVTIGDGDRIVIIYRIEHDNGSFVTFNVDAIEVASIMSVAHPDSWTRTLFMTEGTVGAVLLALADRGCIVTIYRAREAT